MLRTDRLFEVIHLLRRADRPVTAQQIAERIEVSPRTVYRYVASLQSLRVPIEGEAGIGYILRPGYDLPPLNFDEAEQEALVIGMGLLARTGDRELQAAARRVLDKIETGQIVATGLDVSDWGISEDASETGAILRAAIREERELEITYRSLEEEHTTRCIWPLILTYYVEVAVVSCWCHLRQDFRAFRVDRIEDMRPTGAGFPGEGEALRLRMREEQQSGISPSLGCAAG